MCLVFSYLRNLWSWSLLASPILIKLYGPKYMEPNFFRIDPLNGPRPARRLQTRRTYSDKPHVPQRSELPGRASGGPNPAAIHPNLRPPSSLNIFDLSFWAPLAPPLELLRKCRQNRGFTQKVAEYGWDSEATCQFQRKGDAFFPSSCFNVLFQGSHLFLRLHYALRSVVIHN